MNKILLFLLVVFLANSCVNDNKSYTSIVIIENTSQHTVRLTEFSRNKIIFQSKNLNPNECDTIIRSYFASKHFFSYTDSLELVFSDDKKLVYKDNSDYPISNLFFQTTKQLKKRKFLKLLQITDAHYEDAVKYSELSEY